MRYILSLLAACLLNLAEAAPRVYPKGGTCDMEQVYHVNKDTDKTLRALGYTEAMLVDSFESFTAYWVARGWPKAEMLDLYLFECAWNNEVWRLDTYIGIGTYIRPNFITQHRGTIITPDGDFYVRFGCMTGLGHYVGKHPNVYTEKTGTNIGCTPGTSIRVDHFGWSKRQPERNCIFASCWGADYGQVGGFAYQEGVQIEGFRLVGGRAGLTTDPSFVSNGVTMSHPGENSFVKYCMAEGFNNAGYCIIGGTPGLVEVCSAFYNCGPGFDFLGNNGLTNMTGRILSGDNNRGHLIRIRPMNAQSVGGGTYDLTSTKSESRGVLQRVVSVEGALGQLTLNLHGGTADYSGVTCDEMIHVDQGEYEVNVIGFQISSGINSLFYHAASGKRLTGGKASRGNTFCLNDEVGVYLKSRSNMVLSTGGVVVPPPVDPGPVTPPPTTMTATASLKPENAGKAVDADPNSYWQADRSMANGQTFAVTFPAKSTKGVTFTVPFPAYAWWPPKYTIELQVNGSWVKTGGTFTGAATSVATWNATTCTGVRITVAAPNGNWWAVANLSVQ